ncbi:neuroglian-like isoform X2 [Bombyx mandarina]|uniref:Hemolin n=2 Tax=Bombyx TaxID=7090 RepID=A0A8R2QSF8_BOMMO|nr:neuroglian-like isoform X2 [Bombyx mandarina]XP_037866791.1 neuroglian isoform X2 [Bombyx mori]
MDTSRILCFIALVSQAAALLTSPPKIVKQPTQEEILFQVAQQGEVDKPFIIECEAEGEPAPKYKWIKNGKSFEYSSYDNRISQQTGRGTLVISKPKEEDLGQYQCFAYNEWGTAASNSVFVRRAELNSFKETDGQQVVRAEEGKPYKLTCEPPDGHPKPKVYWMLQGDQGQLKTINNSRMTLDPEGNLWFSNVTQNDASEDYAYICTANSGFRNEYKVGNKIYLQVIPTGISPTLNRHEPVRQYTTRKIERGLKGQRVELYCIYGGTPLPQIVWKKNGRSILWSQSITQDNYGKTLVIKYPTYDDQGTYTCEVSNGVGSAQSNSIQLNIEAAPFFTVEPEIQNLAEGETAVIRCEADGTPAPKISWIHNGKPIEQAELNPRRQVSANSIVITDLVKKDTGNYGCNATSAIGYVYKDVYINVQSIPPEIKEGPMNLTNVDGSEAVLKCRVFGAPKPIVKWMKDNVDVTGGKYNITAEGDLVIRDVSFTDVGTYQCYAKNKFGETSAYGSLVVKKHTVITDKPEHYEVAAGSSATFRCNANADDSLPLQIIWLNDGQQIDFESQPRFRMTNDYSLLISDTSELDSGQYTCIARTPVDEARAQATLTVQDKPNPPVLTGAECGARTATVRWRAAGDNRAPILRYSLHYNTSFTPHVWAVAAAAVPPVDSAWTAALSPWANYTFRVVAHNKIGPSAPSGHSDVCTTQPDVPYKNPDNVKGEGTDPTNMLISWTKMPQIEHNGPGFYYLVSWRRNITGQPWEEHQVRDWQQTEHLVTNTPTFQPYKIKVTAVNFKGTSNVTPIEVIGWSGEDRPTQAPGNLSLSQVTSGTSAVLSWTPVAPESLRGHFKGYKIQTWTDAEEDRLKEIFVESDATSALVNKFKPFKKNNVRILAYNGRFNGPASDTLSFVTPEGQPSTVRSFEAYPIGSSAMLLKWEKPMEENGVLTGYKIYYSKVIATAVETPKERKKEIDPKFDRAKLAGLEPNTKYRIEIRAKTKAGEGKGYYVEQSTNNVLTAQPDVPAFETETLPGKEGTAHVIVRWIPSLDGHAGTHFVAWYRLKGHPDWQRTNDITEDDFVILTGLEPGQLYEVKVTVHDGHYFSTSELRTVDTSIDGPIVKPDEKIATAGWFIGVMLALAFLLLLLVLVCVLRRNRGGKYDVHDRELAHGRRDYPDAGFHEYTHPLDNKSRHSMSSGTKPGPESDTDSMAEYGDGETGRFTEDGSFIGQYVPGARALPPPPPPPAPALASPASPASSQPPTYV